jgi:tRNA-2-methylthio-N6-dimethylallyladenosine synthase
LATIDDIPMNEDFNPLFHRLHQTYPNLELFFRIDDTGSLPLLLEKIGYTDLVYDQELVNEYEKILPNDNPSMNAHQSSAYIPISTGCNQFCAYCIVPFARGLERNFTVEHIVEEAKLHLAKGAKEITLLGQIVNKHPNFVQILKALLKLDGLERLRYTSPYPTYYSQELLALHQQEEKLCPHIHIPFQSGSSAVLKKMFRGYTAEECYTFIDQIRSLKRQISITTDMIIGFPGETEEDFAESLKLVDYGKFDMIYMGIYSPRPGTFADKKYVDEIPYAVKHARWEQMNKRLKQISRENNAKEL